MSEERDSEEREPETDTTDTEAGDEASEPSAPANAGSMKRTLGIVVVSLVGVALLFATGVLEFGGGKDSASAAKRSEGDQAERKNEKKRKNKKRKNKKRKNKKRKNKKKHRVRTSNPDGVQAAASTRPPSGVSGLVEAEAWSGLSIYAPVGWAKAAKKAPKTSPWHEAKLIDLEGNELHAWRPEGLDLRRKGWSAIDVDGEGSLFTLVEGVGVFKFDWDASLTWRVVGPYKHAFTVLEDGRTVAVVTKSRDVPLSEDAYLTIEEEGLSTIAPDGTVGEPVWLYDILRDEPAVKERVQAKREAQEDRQAKGKKAKTVDMFEVTGVAAVGPAGDAAWGEDAVLVSLGLLNTIVVVSPKAGKVMWSWGPDAVERPQSPSVLPNGHVLAFDTGTDRRWSRVVEVAPADASLAWSYPSDADASFFTLGRGFVQSLPNDNLLVVFAHAGIASELTREGKRVWSFANPYEWEGKRMPLRLVRLTDAKAEGMQKRLKEAPDDEPAEAPAEAKPPEEAPAPSGDAPSEETPANDGA